VNKFTNKERYEFGDLTREIVRRVSTGEYTLDDLFLLLKALAVFEASISPLAGLFPVKLLIELLNFSLANDVVGRVSSALAMELDRRLKKEILGGENYVLGDLLRELLPMLLGLLLGKVCLKLVISKCLSLDFAIQYISDSYSFGDVTKTVISSIKSNQLKVVNTKKEPLLLGTKSLDDRIEQSVSEALEKWDEALLEKDGMKERQTKVEQYVDLIEKGE
jgi:hypothetical protein